MSFNLRLKGSAIALLPAATLASALVIGAAQTASAQSTTLLNDCSTASPICSNGAASTFPFPLFVNLLQLPLSASGAANDNLYNYGSRGSGGGITGFLSCAAGGSTGVPNVPNPTAFATTDAPLTQAHLDRYYSATGCFSQGFGPIVELPVTSGSVAFVYNTNANLDDGETAVVGGAAGPTGRGPGINLTVQQWCHLYNGTAPGAAAGLPADLANATGVRRSDSSGTTFIISSSLTHFCGQPIALGGLDEWKVLNAGGVPTSIYRGRGQVGVPDSDPACLIQPVLNDLPDTDLATPGVQAPAGVTPGTRTNTVCWPSAFFSGSGNPGVATAVNAATNRFGYVQFSTAAGLDTPAPGTTFNAVDVDLNPGNNPAGSNRLFPNLDIADLENPFVSNFFAPYSGNVDPAIFTSPDISAAFCRTVLDTASPTAGYPIVGVSYLLQYGDYLPERRPSGVLSPAGTRFLNQGGTLRDRHRAIFAPGNHNSFAGTTGRQLAIDLGYAPLPAVRQTQAFVTATQCIQAVNGLNTRDPLPGGQVAP
jgi:ABC-type phosphate transport system substrate-binding protein